MPHYSGNLLVTVMLFNCTHIVAVWRKRSELIQIYDSLDGMLDLEQNLEYLRL